MGSSREKGMWGCVTVAECIWGTSSLPQEALQQLTRVPHKWGVRREGSDTAAKCCGSVPQVDSEHSSQELYTPWWIFRKYKGRSLIFIWVNVLLGCLLFIRALTIFFLSHACCSEKDGKSLTMEPCICCFLPVDVYVITILAISFCVHAYVKRKLVAKLRTPGSFPCFEPIFCLHSFSFLVLPWWFHSDTISVFSSIHSFPLIHLCFFFELHEHLCFPHQGGSTGDAFPFLFPPPFFFPPLCGICFSSFSTLSESFCCFGLCRTIIFWIVFALDYSTPSGLTQPGLCGIWLGVNQQLSAQKGINNLFTLRWFQSLHLQLQWPSSK